MKTEKEKFLAWYEEQKKNGLIDMKICPNMQDGIPPGTTEEDIFAALNAMNAAVAEGRVTPFDDTKICDEQQKLNEKTLKELNERHK